MDSKPPTKKGNKKKSDDGSRTSPRRKQGNTNFSLTQMPSKGIDIPELTYSVKERIKRYESFNRKNPVIILTRSQSAKDVGQNLCYSDLKTMKVVPFSKSDSSLETMAKAGTSEERTKIDTLHLSTTVHKWEVSKIKSQFEAKYKSETDVSRDSSVDKLGASSSSEAPQQKEVCTISTVHKDDPGSKTTDNISLNKTHNATVPKIQLEDLFKAKSKLKPASFVCSNKGRREILDTITKTGEGAEDESDMKKISNVKPDDETPTRNISQSTVLSRKLQYESLISRMTNPRKTEEKALQMNNNKCPKDNNLQSKRVFEKSLGKSKEINKNLIEKERKNKLDVITVDVVEQGLKASTDSPITKSNTKYSEIKSGKHSSSCTPFEASYETELAIIKAFDGIDLAEADYELQNTLPYATLSEHENQKLILSPRPNTTIDKVVLSTASLNTIEPEKKVIFSKSSELQPSTSSTVDSYKSEFFTPPREKRETYISSTNNKPEASVVSSRFSEIFYEQGTLFSVSPMSEFKTPPTSPIIYKTPPNISPEFSNKKKVSSPLDSTRSEYITFLDGAAASASSSSPLAVKDAASPPWYTAKAETSYSTIFEENFNMVSEANPYMHSYEDFVYHIRETSEKTAALSIQNDLEYAERFSKIALVDPTFSLTIPESVQQEQQHNLDYDKYFFINESTGAVRKGIGRLKPPKSKFFSDKLLEESLEMFAENMNNEEGNNKLIWLLNSVLVMNMEEILLSNNFLQDLKLSQIIRMARRNLLKLALIDFPRYYRKSNKEFNFPLFELSHEETGVKEFLETVSEHLVPVINVMKIFMIGLSMFHLKALIFLEQDDEDADECISNFRNNIETAGIPEGMRRTVRKEVENISNCLNSVVEFIQNINILSYCYDPITILKDCISEYPMELEL
ncbi:uncharacterized protein LOC111636643 isoform X1 [Centruroides sculpturatus]|uniref:uncharacterized protein LOC111636643 isoform X1 n=1 Tax=Centruroides sculpturatus TaxID=218467 RepID=UPI000C6D6049|nr:uncharacterized protein LOC111636643 isoform X1 [Centruroides sculpturatus]